MASQRLYITKKHQDWCLTAAKDLVDYLDGPDDEIYEFLVHDTDFSIILKNDCTFEVVDTQQEAIDYVEHTYRNYSIVKNEQNYCFIDRNDLNKAYLTAGDAQDNDCFDYVYCPTGFYYLAKYGKILFVTDNEDEAREKMYEHYKAKYTYLL